jgi:hypothetical protein
MKNHHRKQGNPEKKEAKIICARATKKKTKKVCVKKVHKYFSLRKPPLH